MSTFSPVILSGSTQGKQVKVVATATAGTTVHATGISATVQDEIWLWATNSDATALKLTIEFGGVASPDDSVEVTIPPESGPVLVIPGWRLTGSGAVAATVAAFAATANVITIAGYVNRYQP